MDSPCPLVFLRGGLPAPPPGQPACTLDGRTLSTREDLFLSLARSLSFPGYFGENWDALDECLADLGWLEAPKVLLVIREAEHVLEAVPGERATFLEILAGATRLLTLFQSSSDDLLAWTALCRELGLPFRRLQPGQRW
jgi:RNAse (barnase) inhibitor barstar